MESFPINSPGEGPPRASSAGSSGHGLLLSLLVFTEESAGPFFPEQGGSERTHRQIVPLKLTRPTLGLLIRFLRVTDPSLSL